MTDQYRATPEQWAAQRAWAVDDDDSSCILELRARVEALVDRVEALEAPDETQRQATLEWGKDVDNHSRWIDDHLKRIMALEAGQKTKPSPAVDRVRDLRDQIRSGPECSLVERVARRLARFVCEGLPGDDATPIASAVLCDVAAWILEQAPAPGPLVVMADMLRSEANQ
jgi:hypothetical protein